MINIILIAGMMSVGVFFLKEAMKILTGIESPYALIGLMFLWDGIVIFTMNDYCSKKELAVGIMIGTLIKCLILLRHGTTSYVLSHRETESKKKRSSR